MRIKNVILTLNMPKKFDFLLQLAVLVLITFGTLMIVSTNLGATSNDAYIIIKVLVKQAMFVSISYVLMTFLANNFTMVRAKKMIIFIGIAISIALFATQFFDEILGSKAWLRLLIPGVNVEVTLQPSEFAKVYMVVIMGLYIEMAGKKNVEFWRIVKVPGIFFAIFAIAILLQNDLGAVLVLTLLCAICFLIPSHINIRKQQRGIQCAMLFGVVVMLFMMTSAGLKIANELPVVGHIAVRIENAINPFLQPTGNGYQLINGLYGFARGGITGVGLGNSIQKYGYLTQSDNDFILSIIVEELGIFGLGLIILGYVVIIQRLFYYAFKTKSEGYKIILIGTGLYIFIHFVLNVGGVSGLIPLTGVPLLFISSGGSSLMSIMCAIGISQSIIARIRRQGSASNIKKEPQGSRDSLRKGRGETKIGGEQPYRLH